MQAQPKPIRVEDRGTGQGHKNQEQNQATATAGARQAAPKTKAVLQPIEYPIQKCQSKESGKTTGTIIHIDLLK